MISCSDACSSFYSVAEMDKVKRRRYIEEEFFEAIRKIKNGRLTPGKASKLYRIPKSTFQKYLKRNGQNFMKRGRKFIMTSDDEEALERLDTVYNTSL